MVSEFSFHGCLASCSWEEHFVARRIGRNSLPYYVHEWEIKKRKKRRDREAMEEGERESTHRQETSLRTCPQWAISTKSYLLKFPISKTASASGNKAPMSLSVEGAIIYSNQNKY